MANNPQAQNLRIRAPRGTDVWVTPVLFDHQSVPIGNASGVKPFALFSAYAKTTNDGDIDKKEGFWVAKPYSFQNEAAVAMTQWFKKGHPSNFSHELALTRYPDVISASLTNSRSNFITGHSLAKGRGFGTIFDVPLAPFQSLISLNSAQLASGSYLPHFTAPVGNSYAHPLIS